MTAGLAELRRIAAGTPDPELPVLTIGDLGILRDVRVDPSGRVDVDVTPTYSGCPAIEAIRTDVAARMRDSGHPDVTVNVVLSPPWTTDWMTERGRRRLAEHGIAPPRPRGDDGRVADVPIACPVCGDSHTTEIARFSATPCQALRRCTGCREPFGHFKEH